MLRNRKTGEIMPMNGDLARHDDMIPVSLPDMSKVVYRRGVAYLDEKHIFEDVDDAPEEPTTPPPAPKAKSRAKKSAPKAAVSADDGVDLSDIELPDDDD